MVRKIVSAIALALVSSCFADESCTQGSEFEPPLCAFSLEKIKRVIIVKNGVNADEAAMPAEHCETFVLGEKDVRLYLSQAKSTNENDAHHTLDWSPCYAKGQIEFVNGKTASWSINRFRVGELSIDGVKKTLYCPDCMFAPFN